MKKFRGLYKVIKWLLVFWLAQHFLRFGFDYILQDVLFLLLVPYLILGGIIAPFVIGFLSLFSKRV